MIKKSGSSFSFYEESSNNLETEEENHNPWTALISDYGEGAAGESEMEEGEGASKGGDAGPENVGAEVLGGKRVGRRGETWNLPSQGKGEAETNTLSN